MSQSYIHQSMEHLLAKSSGAYGPSEQEKFYLPSHALPPQSSVSGPGPSMSSGALRPHGTLLVPITGPAGSHQQSGMPIQQSGHAKLGGSITSGHPLRPPPTTVYHTASVSHVSL